jgi:hypothetical protein
VPVRYPVGMCVQRRVRREVLILHDEGGAGGPGCRVGRRRGARDLGAVAAHWKESLLYFVSVGTAAISVAFVMAGMVVNAQTA